MKKLILPLLLSLSSLAQACPEGFLPDNNLQIPINEIAPTGISEEDFTAVQEELKAIYVPVATAQGGKLTFVSNWKSTTVNAFAQRLGHENEDGEEEPPFDDWRVVFLGGLARHKHVTRDGFSLIVCHELGHHFGGAPSYDGETAWASNEGQSDYFSVTKCLRRLWQNSNNTEAIRGKEIDPVLKEKCEASWVTQKDRELCLRIGLAGESIGNLFGSLVTFGKLPKFSTPDPKVVTSTTFGHPKAQCRLDTYLQGAVCQASFDVDFEKNNEVTGSCHPKNGDTVGNRPLCWFKPNVN